MNERSGTNSPERPAASDTRSRDGAMIPIVLLVIAEFGTFTTATPGDPYAVFTPFLWGLPIVGLGLLATIASAIGKDFEFAKGALVGTLAATAIHFAICGVVYG